MNSESLPSSSISPKYTVFPFLNQELPLASNPDTVLPNVAKRPVQLQQARLTTDAFSPGKTLRSGHTKEQLTASTPPRSQGPAQNIVKDYLCPNIVDMNSIMFCHNETKKRERSRRIIDGFFPKKKRSPRDTSMNHGGGATLPSYRSPTQIDMCLAVSPARDPVTARSIGNKCSDVRSHGFRSHRPPSLLYPTQDNRHIYDENFDVQLSRSAWSVRNGSSSPWLERYKLKKSSSSFSPSKPQNCEETGFGTKRQQKYVTLSCVTILDDF